MWEESQVAEDAATNAGLLRRDALAVRPFFSLRESRVRDVTGIPSKAKARKKPGFVNWMG
jgi:hypothetical protein